MRVIESSSVGKFARPDGCEDVVVLTDHLVAVVDGATDVTGRLVDGPEGKVTPGRFAARTLATALESMGPGMDPHAAVAELTAVLDGAIRECLEPVPVSARPCASVVVLDVQLQSVWRVGDCQFRIGSQVWPGVKKVDSVAADFRAAVAAAHGGEGAATIARDSILPLLGVQGCFANTLGEFGYGVVNGVPVPDAFVEVVPLPARDTEVVLASDGYPTMPESLDLAERDLACLLTRDPLCVSELRGTKGLAPGAVSFDDRSWVRVSLP